MPIFTIADATGVSVPTTTETVVLTLTAGPFGSGTPNGVIIRGFAQVTTGAATTNATIRCRQGSVTGPIVDHALSMNTAASTAYNWPYSFNDTSEYAMTPGGVYVITIQQTGATGNGSVTAEATVET